MALKKSFWEEISTV